MIADVHLLLQMFYSDKDSQQARNFRTTLWNYKMVLDIPCNAIPCERVNPHHFNSWPPPAGPYRVNCNICEVCGLNIDDAQARVCECCHEQGREVLACYSCLPQKQHDWLEENSEIVHHWRCSTCRYCAHMQSCCEGTCIKAMQDSAARRSTPFVLTWSCVLQSACRCISLFSKQSSRRC